MLNLATAMTLTGWSKRTLWRRISDGTLVRNDDSVNTQATKLSWFFLKPHLCIPLDEADYQLVEAADGGDAVAQTDLAILFFENERFKAAVYWLELAVKQDYAEAMHLLGTSFLHGQGVNASNALGLMWVAKAASLGHIIATEQLSSITEMATAQVWELDP